MKEQIAWPYSQRALRSSQQPISYLMAQASHNPDLISLAAGLVDYDILPIAESKRVIDAIYQSDQQVAAKGPSELERLYQYGTTEGDPKLRQLLLDHFIQLDQLDYRSQGVSEKDLMITSGSQQLLFLLSDILLDPGDIVITEKPSYFVYAGTLQSLGARVISVPMDESGMRHDQLEAVLKTLESRGELDRLKIVYSVSYHQNPTGITQSEPRKQEVVRILKRFQKKQPFLTIEDAAYRELTYAGEVPISMHAMSLKQDQADPLNVATLMTFSKPYAPGFKTGYGMVPNGLMSALVNLKGNHDFGSAHFCQHLLREAVRTGAYARHVKEACQHYQKKMEIMLQALASSFAPWSEEVSWTKPTGGLYVYMTLPEHIDTGLDGDFFRAAMAEGVLYVPGVFGNFSELAYETETSNKVPSSSEVRLSFGLAKPSAIHEGIQRLARAYVKVRTKS